MAAQAELLEFIRTSVPKSNSYCVLEDLFSEAHNEILGSPSIGPEPHYQQRSFSPAIYFEEVISQLQSPEVQIDLTQNNPLFNDGETFHYHQNEISESIDDNYYLSCLQSATDNFNFAMNMQAFEGQNNHPNSFLGLLNDQFNATESIEDFGEPFRNENRAQNLYISPKQFTQSFLTPNFVFKEELNNQQVLSVGAVVGKSPKKRNQKTKSQRETKIENKTEQNDKKEEKEIKEFMIEFEEKGSKNTKFEPDLTKNTLDEKIGKCRKVTVFTPKSMIEEKKEITLVASLTPVEEGVKGGSIIYLSAETHRKESNKKEGKVIIPSNKINLDAKGSKTQFYIVTNWVVHTNAPSYYIKIEVYCDGKREKVLVDQPLALGNHNHESRMRDKKRKLENLDNSPSKKIKRN